MAGKVVDILPEDVSRQVIERWVRSNLFPAPEMFQAFAPAKSYRPALYKTAYRR